VVRVDAPRRIRPLLLDTNDAVGGIVRGHLLLLRLLDRARFDVHAACLGHGPLLPLFREVPDLTLWTLEAGTKAAADCGGWRGRLRDALSLVPLARAGFGLAGPCRRAGIQVIHTSDKKRSLLLTLLLHRLTGLPYLYHIHNNYIDYRANRLALRRARLIIANSAEMRRDFIRWLGPDLERIRVVYNGMDAEQFSPAPDDRLRREIGAAPDDVLVGITSRLAADKGQDTFLQAAARVLAEAPRARFVIVGDDSVFSDNADYIPRLKTLAVELGIAGRVHFTGFRADMVQVNRGLDLVVNAAWREAFGLVVVEAMACGKPVAGTDAGGIPEILTHGRDGFLYPPRDPAALAAVLLPLVRDADLRARIGAAARQTVLARFTIQTYVRAIETLYEELAAAPAASEARP